MTAERVKDPCRRCACNCCRWIGTDNCIEDVLKPCFKCGETNYSKKPIFSCKGFRGKDVWEG